MQIRARASAAGVCLAEKDAEKQGAQLRPPTRASAAGRPVMSACACAAAAGVSVQKMIT